MMRIATMTTAAILALGLGPVRAEESPAQVSAPAGTVVQKVHAVGAQIYECKPDGGGGLAWSFREPIATLMSDGRTVGRHFAGPSWQMSDGSLVTGETVATAPGRSVDDVPWLRLAVKSHSGGGILDDVTVVQRVSTVGGNRHGPCASAGAFVAVPYSADYIFSRP